MFSKLLILAFNRCFLVAFCLPTLHEGFLPCSNIPHYRKLGGERILKEEHNEISKPELQVIFIGPALHGRQEHMEEHYRPETHQPSSYTPYSGGAPQTPELQSDAPLNFEVNPSPIQTEKDVLFFLSLLKPSSGVAGGTRNFRRINRKKTGSKIYAKKNKLQGPLHKGGVTEPYAELIPGVTSRNLRPNLKSSRLIPIREDFDAQGFIINIPERCPPGTRMDQGGTCREIFGAFVPLEQIFRKITIVEELNQNNTKAEEDASTRAKRPSEVETEMDVTAVLPEDEEVSLKEAK